jgi:hypothetical protein
VGFVVHKNVFFELIEDETISMSIGVVDWGKEPRFASRTGDQIGAKRVF